MIKRLSILFIVVALLLSGFVPGASAQPNTPSHNEGEYLCKPSNIATVTLGEFQYLEKMNVLAMSVAGELVLYDLDQMIYNQPGSTVGDTYEFREITRTPYGWGNYVAGYEVTALRAAIVALDKETGMIGLNYPWGIKLVLFSREDGLLKTELSFKWSSGDVWSDGSDIYIRSSSLDDGHTEEYLMAYAYGDGIYLQELMPSNLPNGAFRSEHPHFISARMSRDWGDGERHLVDFPYSPELLAAPENLMVVRSGHIVAGCPQNHSSLPVKFRALTAGNPPKNEEVKNLFIK